MDITSILTYISAFVSGGAIASLITLRITSRKTKQTNVSVGKGDVVGGDKNG